MIEYMGTHKDADGVVVYAFLVNGVPKELREDALGASPGFLESLPPLALAQVEAHRRAGSGA